jgi:Icc-related predicted phosphoesterase
MKIMAFSDLHASARAAQALVEAAEEADLVIGAGDFCNARRGLDAALALLDGISAPIVAVPGNAESAEELRAAAGPGMTVLHGSGCEIAGLRLFGLGGAVPETPFGDWSWDLSEDEAAALLEGCGKVDIMICHSPPKGIADMTSQGVSVGSVAVRAAIRRVQPQLVFCGHIHDSWGETGRIGAAQVTNLGPVPNWFAI